MPTLTSDNPSRDTTMERFFFVHVMRTGGTTFEQQLRKNFPRAAVYPNPDLDFPGGDVLHHLDVPYLLGLPPERLAALRVFYGHFPFVVTEMLDPRTVSPLDTGAILASVGKTGRLLVVDEAFGPCGLASEIAAQVADAGFNDLDAPIRRLHGAFAPTPYSPPLEAETIPNARTIAAAIRDLVNE